MKQTTTPHASNKNPQVPSSNDQVHQWSTADSAQLYGIHRWGNGYFSINEKGHVVVQPMQSEDKQIDLKTLLDDLQQRDLQPPLLIRFTDVLKHRLDEMAQAFGAAIDEFDFQGDHRSVYPIKVNQQRHVIQDILTFGHKYGVGLEAGSKPELLASMAMVDDDSIPIICNGFKDEQFIEAVSLATKMGRYVLPIVEKYSELILLTQYAKKHQVRPRIGVRVKLATKGAGRWEESGGHRSKFGLFISEVLEAVEFLRSQDMLDCLKLVHFHLGSQVNDIRAIKNAIIELTRIYVELWRIGAGLECIDVGGGLGVDYDGNKTDSASSINYSLQEYANDVVFHIREVCDEAGAPHPTIITESGRAMVAYHSVLIFNVLGWSGFDRFEVPESLSDPQDNHLPKPVQVLFDSYHALAEDNFVEYYHDALLARDETVNLFNLGYCSLEHRGLAEKLFFGICAKGLRIVRTLPYVPEEFGDLEPMLSDTYFCNFSIFQSLPDSWAIEHVFPVMPIHRLNEEPTSRGVLADITCDSDGRIDSFIDQGNPKHVLELHPMTGAEYYLSVFLVGAYQEILGDLHNLLGDTHVVHVSLDEQGHPLIDEVIEGDTVTEVLQYVQFNTEELRRCFRNSVERAVRQDRLTLEEARLLRRFYDQGLSGYTYLT